MSRIGLAAASIAVLCSGFAGPFAHAQVPTPEMFGALPSVSDAEISPDGKTLAMLRDANDITFIEFRQIDAPDAKPVGTRINDAVARNLYWANDDVVLVLVTQARKQQVRTGLKMLQTSRWMTISRSTLQSRLLFDNEEGFFVLSPGTLMATIPEDPNRVVFSRWTSKARIGNAGQVTSIRLQSKATDGIALFSIQLDDGARTILAAGTPQTTHWVVDAKGQAVARVDEAPIAGSAHTQTRVYARRESAAGFSRAQTGDKDKDEDNSADLVPAGFSVTSGKMLATTQLGNTSALVEYDLQSGAAGKTIFHNPDFNISGVIYDSRVAAVRGVQYTDDLPRMVHLNAAEQQIQDSLAAAIPGSAPIIWSRSADGKRFVVKVAYTDHPDQWFLYDDASQQLNMVGTTYAALDGKVLAKKRKYDYTSDDGLKIPGYLTAPEGESKGKLPLIVLPHGGPWARDDQTFGYWAFFYASRGYLVYQPNFRGSNGYGTAFLDAGNGQWGRKMQDDITQGVQKLIAEGLVDGKRICIVGASYGGYAALVGATMTAGVYACAVSVNGVSNVGDLISDGNREFWEERIGKRTDYKSFHQISPMRQAEHASAPILLIHAKDDTVVNAGQSRAMAKALAANGKSHQLIELDGEDHWLSRGATRTEMLARSIAFIDKHIGKAAE